MLEEGHSPISQSCVNNQGVLQRDYFNKYVCDAGIKIKCPEQNHNFRIATLSGTYFQCTYKKEKE